MKKKIIFSDGGKGGVGKSMVSISIVDYLLAKGEAPFVIDADVTNPDVARLFQDHPICMTETYDLRETQEWMQLLETVETISNEIMTIVVNLPASFDFKDHIKTAVSVLDDLDYKIRTFFTINRQSDSLNLLGESLVSGSLFYSDDKIVVLNGLFGTEDQFTRFHESKIKRSLLEQEGKLLYMPELYYRSCDMCLVEKNKTFSEAIQEKMLLVYRHQINQWLQDIQKRIDSTLNLKPDEQLSYEVGTSK